MQVRILFLVAQSICSTLDDADLVFQSFNKAEGDLVLWPALMVACRQHCPG